MRIYFRSAVVLAVNIAASLAQVALDAWRGTIPEPPPAVQSMPTQRDVSVDDATIELAQHEAAEHLAKCCGYLPTSDEDAAETLSLEAMWRAPAVWR